MYAREKAKQEVLNALRKYIEVDVSIDDIETPPDNKMGDFAYPVFQAAKKMKKNPAELATEIAVKIGPSDLVDGVKAVGPYVNFTLKMPAFGAKVLEDVELKKEKYGQVTVGEGKKIIVDYAQPNTHKEFHVGHIRNAVLGQSIINTLRASGYEVVAASYIGDVGAHVAKALWGMEKFHKGEEFDKETRAQRLGQIYTEATKAVEENEDYKLEIAEVLKAIEAQQDPWFSLWKKTREWSLDSFKAIFKELSIEPDAWYFESEVEKPGKEIVSKMLTDGIAKKSEGAVIVDLEKEDLGAFLVLKSDGSSLYATKDLALAMKKEKDHGADRQIFVVDVRQSLHFKQLFATLNRMGFEKQLIHIYYDMVNLPGATMSSRAGNIITYEDLRDQMSERLIKETKERHEDWSDKKIAEVAKAVSIASIEFMMLRQDAESIITFDMDEAMSFDGFTAPYLLYTVARIGSIEKKAKKKAKSAVAHLTHEKEAELLRKLSEYPEVIERAGLKFHISAIAVWVFELAQLFNEYYHDVRILDDEDLDRMRARLALIGAVRVTMKNGLKLLNIETLKEM
ncbi:arginine--tRNA ligase [Candidatus Uhrbacteria bacterium]|jgi:arginyl-tRNA synthetase|nr:arginine--tRNA ligase [Candidatus Uhrbacteria bacterium]MBT7716870.1 arginine--tRNA ligase [Candidatus Uhrbacteria bacterium]